MEWKNKLKQFGPSGFILIGIISVLLFYLNANNTNIITALHILMAKPFTFRFLQYGEEYSPLHKALQFFVFILIYGLFFVGIVNAFIVVKNLFKKKPALIARNIHDYNSYIDLEDKLGDAMIALEERFNSRVIDEKVTIFMNTKEMEIKRIFGVSERQIDFIWYFHGKNNDIELVYLKKPADIHGAGKLINSALDMPDVRVKEAAVNSQLELQNCPIKQFISVRNYGHLKLGLAVLILKDNVFTEENLQEFTYYTSKMILLGTYIPFLRQIKKKKQLAN
ncbi:hypothetical protein [Peribacillus tepidiphilus]|uniref:hypothetical protein n=1 Tax=Peribacillus tepidiphilus TaxID=2652445 RepID=UPI001290D156|nr:hypothetical protein [Peribacillus tepidiphilus]